MRCRSLRKPIAVSSLAMIAFFSSTSVVEQLHLLGARRQVGAGRGELPGEGVELALLLLELHLRLVVERVRLPAADARAPPSGRPTSPVRAALLTVRTVSLIFPIP